MINKALREMTTISEDEDINTENYVSALSYLDNIYKVAKTLSGFISLKDIDFLPTYKDIYIAERLGIMTRLEENQLRLFKIKSKLFLGETSLVKNILSALSTISTEINTDDDIITFILSE